MKFFLILVLRSSGHSAKSVNVTHVELQNLSVNSLYANHKIATFCVGVLGLGRIIAVCKVRFRSISKQSYLLLQEETVLNFNIPCEVLLTILVTAERKDKENSVHVCGNREKGLGYEYWKHGIKCEERDGLRCTGGGWLQALSFSDVPNKLGFALGWAAPIAATHSSRGNPVTSAGEKGERRVMACLTDQVCVSWRYAVKR